MEDERSSEVRRGDCCGGGSDQANGSVGGCDCGAAPPHRPWLRTLIAVSVILAAVGVGAYSLMAKRAVDPGKQAASCCPAAVPAAGKAAPAGRSCCPGGSAAAKCAAQTVKGADSSACRRTCGSR
jgi:hypothetical protein